MILVRLIIDGLTIDKNIRSLAIGNSSNLSSAVFNHIADATERL